MLFVSGLAYGQSCPTLPVGASVLGYTTQLFYDQPTLAEVSTTDTDSGAKWYPGAYSNSVIRNVASRELLSTHASMLAIGLGASVTSETHDSTEGGLPFLSGARGFYVEIAMNLSSNDSDHFIGLYLETAEHNLAKADHLASDPNGYERWTEIDVSESGYGPGSLSSLINWQGTYPHYGCQSHNNFGRESELDWTVEHRYGVSYDPVTNVLQWYIDDNPTWKETASNSVIKDFHYYLVMDASSHGSHVPYEMYIHYVRAYTTRSN
jgi:hypothetical protein